MRADNSHRLLAATRDRTQRTRERAIVAIGTLTDGPISVARLAKVARVSRSWIYTQPDLIEQIEDRATTFTADRSTRPAGQRASTASLLRRLELAHERIRQLSAENAQLHDELARAYGQLREHH